MRDRLADGQKTLDQELKLFRQLKEVELKNIIAEFVAIQKSGNLKLKNQWQGFLTKTDASHKDLGASMDSQHLK